MTDKDLFLENEIKANYILAKVLFITCAAGAVSYILVRMGFFATPRVNWKPIMIFFEILMLSGGILCYRVKGSGKWLKVVLITIFIATCVAMNFLFTSSVAMLMSAPVVISIRYFSKKFSLYVAIVTFVLMFFASYFGANYGIIDLNVLELPLGTVISMKNTTWLIDEVELIDYDHVLHIYNTLLFDFLPNGLLYLVISATSILIAGNGRDLIMKQQELNTESSKIGNELDTASRIQYASLPHVFPPFPDRTEFDIYAVMDPAREVGGDFYDFFLIDNDHLALAVADVSGKGIPASLFMMRSKATIRSYAQSRRSPAEILISTNKDLIEDNEEEMFVTVWLGILETSTGRLTYASAGHTRMAICHDGEWKLDSKGHTGIALGFLSQEEMQDVSEKYRIVDSQISLKPGDVIIQYTDGVTEATDASNQLFGEYRILEACREASDTTLDGLLKSIRNRIDEFTGEVEQFDDITMLALRFMG